MKRDFISILTIVSFFVLINVSFGLDKNTKVAVLDIVSRVQEEKIDTVTLSEMVQTELVNKKVCTVVERAFLSKIIDEQKLQITGMTESDITRIGNLAGAAKIIVGALSKMAGKYVLMVKIIDTKAGSIDYSEQVMNYSLDEIVKSVPKIVNNIIGFYNGDIQIPQLIVTNTDFQIQKSDVKTDIPVKTNEEVQKDLPKGSDNFFLIQIAIWTPLQIIPQDFKIYGFDLNLFYGKNYEVIGVTGGVVNHVVNKFIGLQACAGANIIDNEMWGVQAGPVNFAKKVYGVQIGVFNFTEELFGAQIGLCNIAAKGWVSFMPILNISF